MVKQTRVVKPFAFACAGLLALAVAAIGVGGVGTAGAATTSGQTNQNQPLFTVLHPVGGLAPADSLSIPNWDFSYTFAGNSTTYTEQLLGTNPSGGGSTTIPIYIIPIKLKSGTYVTNPKKKVAGLSPVQSTIDSPIFQDQTYTQGGTDVGDTQYEDAVQRASLWGLGGSSSSYHVLLSPPTLEPVQTLTVPKRDGVIGSPFGTQVMEVYDTWFDDQIQPMIAKLGIPADAVPIFLFTQTYLTESTRGVGCCIGGYHSYNGKQPYVAATYMEQSGEFSQDVSGLSHEMAETINDPETDNTDVPCGIYEVADPLEEETSPKYGDYPYTIDGFTYHLQDIALPPYFGAPTADSVNGWTTFQGTSLTVCENGG